MTQDQFIQTLLDAAKKAGIQEAEVFSLSSDSFRAMVFEGEISEYKVNTSGGLSLRGMTNGRMGTAFTEAMDEDAIPMLVQGVIDSARLIDTDDKETLFAGSPSYATVDACATHVDEAQAKLEFALAMEKRTTTLDPRVQNLDYCMLATTHGAQRIVNTFGLDLKFESDIAYAYVSAIAREGDRTTTGGHFVKGRTISDLSLDELSKNAVAEAVSMLPAKPCESGVMPAILRYDAMGDLLDTFCDIFSAEQAQKNLSLLKGRLGEEIAAPCVTLIDDPLLEGGMGTCPFDAEGVAAYKKAVIEGGKLQTLLHNRKTAEKDGLQSTGNASRSGYAGSLGISPSNLYFAPGTEDLDALCARMGDGLLITELGGLHAGANSVSGDFSLITKGYLIRGGKRAQAVEQITVAGNFFQLLKDVLALGSDLKFGMGLCNCPSVWVKSLSVAGA